MKKYLRFFSVVTKNEFKAIRGSGYRSIIYLSVILYLAFLCVGFSNNALIYQNKLAGNPFSNWVNIGITRMNRDSAEQLIQVLSDTVLKNRYFIKNRYLSKEFGASFLDREGACTGLPLPKVTTIDAGSSLVHDLLNKNNVVKTWVTGNVFETEPLGFVITEAVLNRLGFNPDSVTCLSYRLFGDKYVPVPILAVVRELPNHADVLCTDSFYMLQMHNYRDDSAFSKLFIDTRNVETANRLSMVIRKSTGLAGDVPVYDSVKGFGRSLHVLYFPGKTAEIRRLFKNKLRSLYALQDFRNIHFGTYCELETDTFCNKTENSQEFRHNLNFDYLAVEFSKLDSLKAFSSYIRTRYAMSVNMETVTQRQNYLYSLNISLGAIILVLTLAVLSISIFLSNILKNHLDRVKRNLGNFMAFGTGELKITGIYMLVVMKILSVSTILALLLAYVSGELFDRYLLKHILVLETDQDFFSLFNPWLVLFLLVVYAVAMTKTFITVMLLVRKSPGDLIYERESKTY